MKFRISVLTIILIIFFLFSSFNYFLDKSLYDTHNELCNVLKPVDLISSSDSEREEWGDCILLSSHYLDKVGLKLYASTILILLIILSWKVDYLKKEG